MKNILKFIIAFSGFVLLFSSCENDLDINQNPNNPGTVDKAFVLTSAQASFATVLGGFFTNYAGFLVQYHTQAPGANQYVDIDAYNISPAFTNNLWTEVFAGGIKDLDFVVEKANKEKDNATYLMAKVLRAYMYQIMTDFYGDIPYADVLTGISDLNPKITDQKEIYKALINSLDEALLRYTNNPNGAIVQPNDVLLKGDMKQWIQFLNTLKLKIYMRLTYTSMADQTAVMDLLTVNNFLTEDISFDLFSDETNKRNPFADVQLHLLNGVNHSASSSLLDFYYYNEDPRISKVYIPGFYNEGEFIGISQGAYLDSGGIDFLDFATPNVQPTTPVYFMTVSESNFLQAEALIRYANGAGAQVKYEKGIRASFGTYGLSAAEADELIAGVYAYEDHIIIDEAIRQVMIQKWASMAYVNNIEAYFEQIRTGYPEFIPSSQEPDYSKGNLIPSKLSRLSGGFTPKSVLYPDVEVSTNTQLKQKESVLQKVWWDQKNK